MKIAFIGCLQQNKFGIGVTNDEYTELYTHLRKNGFDVETKIWNSTDVDWSRYDLVLLKSPWDYHEHYLEFVDWLDHLTARGIKVLNPAATVKWNADKHYLQDIEKYGLPIVPTVFKESQERFEGLEHYFGMFETDKLVLKPTISAGAAKTLLCRRANDIDNNAIEQLYNSQSFMIQPFIKEVGSGEWSLLFFNQTFSHSLLKIPKQGDFRVQHYHGGVIEYKAAPTAMVEAATAYVEQFAKHTLYARVDGIVIDGKFHLMELEMIEPYLFLDQAKGRLDSYTTALRELIK